MGLTPTFGFDTSAGCDFPTVIFDSLLLSLDFSVADWAGVCLETVLLLVL